MVEETVAGDGFIEKLDTGFAFGWEPRAVIFHWLVGAADMLEASTFVCSENSWPGWKEYWGCDFAPVGPVGTTAAANTSK